MISDMCIDINALAVFQFDIAVNFIQTALMSHYNNLGRVLASLLYFIFDTLDEPCHPPINIFTIFLISELVNKFENFVLKF